MRLFRAWSRSSPSKMSQLAFLTPQVINYWLWNHGPHSETQQFAFAITKCCNSPFLLLKGEREGLAFSMPELCHTNYFPNYAVVNASKGIPDIHNVSVSVPCVSFDTLSKLHFCDVKSTIFAQIITGILCKLIILCVLLTLVDKSEKMKYFH